MSKPWKEICAGCRHLNAQEPNLHCYMFKDAPDNRCAQHTATMDDAKKNGKLVQLSELPLAVHDTLVK